MKRSAIALAMAAVLLLLALFLPYTGSDYFDHKGLPFSYYQVWYTPGICPGINGTVEDGYAQDCSVHHFPNNYLHLAEDLAIVGLLAIALLYITDRKLVDRVSSHKNAALYILVGGSIIFNAAFWFLNKSSIQESDSGISWGAYPRQLSAVLTWPFAILFLVANLIYLIRSIFKHLSSQELIIRTVLCLIAIGSFFVVLIAVNQ